MGKPKWNLPFGGETMFERIARRLSEAVELLIVVGPAEGSMPRLQIEGRTVLLARDRVGDRGPLEGLAVGLATAAEQGIDFTYATACDTPLVRPEFVRLMLERAQGYDAVVVRTADGEHPLPAVYATRLVDQLEAILAAGERRAGALAALGSTRWMTGGEFADCDPELLSVRNLNTPEEYAAALAQL